MDFYKELNLRNGYNGLVWIETGSFSHFKTSRSIINVTKRRLMYVEMILSLQNVNVIKLLKNNYYLYYHHYNCYFLFFNVLTYNVQVGFISFTSIRPFIHETPVQVILIHLYLYYK